MVECLTMAVGILAHSEEVFKGTGADQRFVKNALKICMLPPAYYKYWFLSYDYLIQQNTTYKSKFKTAASYHSQILRRLLLRISAADLPP